MDTDTTDAPAQEQTQPVPPAVFINIAVPAHIEHLARNPPPRKIYPHLQQPSEDECERAIRTQPGASCDSCRLVWIAAKIYNDNDGGDSDSVTDCLAFRYLVSGHEWPLAVRAAILASIRGRCSWNSVLPPLRSARRKHARDHHRQCVPSVELPVSGLLRYISDDARRKCEPRARSSGSKHRLSQESRFRIGPERTSG